MIQSKFNGDSSGGSEDKNAKRNVDSGGRAL